MYACGTGNSLLIVGVYVDDLVITGVKHDEMLGFKEEIKQLFSMSNLGLLRYYFRLEVNQERGCTTITQAAYVGKLLERAGWQIAMPRTHANGVSVQTQQGEHGEA